VIFVSIKFVEVTIDHRDCRHGGMASIKDIQRMNIVIKKMFRKVQQMNCFEFNRQK